MDIIATQDLFEDLQEKISLIHACPAECGVILSKVLFNR